MRAGAGGLVLIVTGCVGARPEAPSAPAGCVDVTEKPAPLGHAVAADEYALTINARSASATSWGKTGNEAVVLEITGAHGLIGHLILHQGAAQHDYGMHVGALAAGEELTVKVSKLSAQHAKHRASICSVNLVPVANLGDDADGVRHAPILRWPVQKRFNDVPLLVGWSRAHSAYQSVMTNEDGGTAMLCGGGAKGMAAEVARWGRSMDIEAHYSYGGDDPTWERCTGRESAVTLRMEAAHPILYYGNGHNRLFENRGGYGQACGASKADKPNGDLAGWNTKNPSNALADDDGKVIVLRPLPVALEPLDGRREALADHYAPWLYRVSSLELEREHKIDDKQTFGMTRYLYVDVRIAGVGGTGDAYCAKQVSGGFVLRAVTTRNVAISSPQITAPYAGGGNHEWKRVAIALPEGVKAADIDHFIFDAYDGNGIYVTAIGDAFIPAPEGDNGATLDYVRRGTTPLAYYVDDHSQGCSNGTTHGGPGGTSYDCVGGQVTIAK